MTEPEPLLGAPGALLVIISGPSGVGKDTIIDALRARDPSEGGDYHYVVTCTTRGPRPGEIPDVSYHFLSEAEFHALHDADELLEANEVHGNWYGTPRREVARALAAGRDVILKIDVQGARVVKERVPDALLVFIVPPSPRGPVPAAALAGDGDGRRARDPPAQRRDRARAPGRLRPGRGQRDGRGRSDGRGDRGDRRPGEAAQQRPADPRHLGGKRRVATMLELPTDRDDGDARVEVAVDAPGGPRAAHLHLHACPPALGPLEPGEAVLVPFGRGGRQAIGVVVGRGAARAAGGPELRDRSPPASAATARCCRRSRSRFAARHRGSLPGPAGDGDPVDAPARDARAAGAARRGHARGRGAARPSPNRRSSAPTLDLLDELAGRAATGPRPVDARGPGRAAPPAPGARRRGPGRAHLDAAGRRRRAALRAAAVAHARTGRPRDDARGRRTSAGPAARAAPDGGARRAGRRPAAARPTAAPTASPAAPLAERHGSSSLAGLVRRGLLRAEVRERPRRPLAGRPAAVRGARPAGSGLTAAQAAAVSTRARRHRAPGPDADAPRRRDGRRQDRDLRRGDRRLARRRPARRCCWSPRSPSPRRSSTASAPSCPSAIALLHSGLGEGERADEWRRIRAGRGGPRRGHADRAARAARRRRA